jgi:hypothetical protein
MGSQRARSFLASLRREDALSVGEVQELFAAQGIPAEPAWLAFHGEYAGYVQIVAGGPAPWGLAFPNERLQGGEPRTIIAMRYKGVVEHVQCADIHPDFDYLLGRDGRFIGDPFPSDSFGVKVERDALMWEFVNAGPAQREYSLGGVSVLDLRDALVAELRDYLVPEASDSHARYYCSPDKLLLESLENTTVKLVVRSAS